MKVLRSRSTINLSHFTLSREQWLVIAATVALVMFGLAAELRVQAARSFDFPVILALNVVAHRSRILDHLLQALAGFDLFQGLTLVALAYGASAAATGRLARVRLAIGIVGAAAAAISSRLIQLQMPGLARPIFDPTLPFRRPYGGGPEWLRDWSSFPSDHATLLWGMAIAILMVDRRIGALSVAVAFLSSLARTYCGLHYVTDNLGGALLGAAVVCALLAAAEPFEAGLLAFAKRRPALVAILAFLFGAQAATMFSEARVIADAASRNISEIIASPATARSP
jgi:membrane-associated phospholipid phosphatase